MSDAPDVSGSGPTDDAVRWAAIVTSELGIASEDLERMSASVLDMVRDVAHGVNRPSAPLTAFLVGLAAGRSAHASGAGLDDEVHARVEQVGRLVQRWETVHQR